MAASDERFSVSGWEDDFQDIDEEKHPHGKSEVFLKTFTRKLLTTLSLQETPEKEILWAAENGKLDTVMKLVKSDPNLVHVRDKDGYTPLQRACYGNHVKVAEYLLSHGASISTKSEMGWEPLHSVCQWNNKECAQLLLQNGADVNAVSEGGTYKSYRMIRLVLTHFIVYLQY